MNWQKKKKNQWNEVGQLRLSSLREQNKKRIQKDEQSLRDLWDTIKHTNLNITGVPEGEERRDMSRKTMWKNNSWKLSKCDSNTYIHQYIQETQWIPGIINWKKSIFKHIIIKLFKDKYKIPKVARTKQLIYKRDPLKINRWFLIRIYEGQMAIQWYFQSTEIRLSIKNSISSKTIFKNEGEMKTFPDEQKCSGLDNIIHVHSIQPVSCMYSCKVVGC